MLSNYNDDVKLEMLCMTLTSRAQSSRSEKLMPQLQIVTAGNGVAGMTQLLTTLGKMRAAETCLRTLSAT